MELLDEIHAGTALALANAPAKFSGLLEREVSRRAVAGIPRQPKKNALLPEYGRSSQRCVVYWRRVSPTTA
jgi:hypothetical protein